MESFPFAQPVHVCYMLRPMQGQRLPLREQTRAHCSSQATLCFGIIVTSLRCKCDLHARRQDGVRRALDHIWNVGQMEPEDESPQPGLCAPPPPKGPSCPRVTKMVISTMIGQSEQILKAWKSPRSALGHGERQKTHSLQS